MDIPLFFLKRSTTGLLAIAILIHTSFLFAQDWPAIRGVNGEGKVNPKSVLTTGKDIELRLAWKKKIGSGYSSVIVAGERLIALYSDGEQDQIACLNKNDGTESWKFSLGPTFVGANGSFDGPLSTPVIHHDSVIALSPTGRLTNLNLENGEVQWYRELTSDFEAKQPLYGFVTSPIMVDDTLIVQIGSDEHAIVGLDPSTGQTKWHVGSDTINSQSPAVVEVNGQKILLGAGGKTVFGVNAKTGELVLEFAHEGGNASAVMPVAIGDNRFMLTLDDSFSKAFEIEPGSENDEKRFSGKEIWQNRSIKNTYNIPVVVGKNAFGYSTRILTCIDIATGEAHWKSRAPGDGFLIAVDDHLIINTKQGSLHLAKASDDKFDELARLDVFHDLVWSVPAYSDGSVFIRSLGEIAKVDIVSGSTETSGVALQTMPIGKNFQVLLESVDSAESGRQQSIVDEFIAGQNSFPIIEGNVIHFIYQGDAKDVALASDIFGARQERKMIRAGNTNLFYYAMELESDQRANYFFLVDYKPETDSKNPNTIISSVYKGEMEFAIRLRSDELLRMSRFSMPDWKMPDFLKNLQDSADSKTNMESREVSSEIMETRHKIDVLLPPGFDKDANTTYPVIYVFGGSEARQFGKMDQISNYLFSKAGSSIPHGILVFLDGQGGPDFLESIAKEIVPYVEKEFRGKPERTARTCMGNSFNAITAFSLAASHPDVFANIVCQSPLVFEAASENVLTQMAKIEMPMRCYFEWGNFDMFNPHENWDIRATSQELFDKIGAMKHIKVEGGMVHDSTDWGSWRSRLDKVLKFANDQ